MLVSVNIIQRPEYRPGAGRAKLQFDKLDDCTNVTYGYDTANFRVKKVGSYHISQGGLVIAE